MRISQASDHVGALVKDVDIAQPTLSSHLYRHIASGSFSSQFEWESGSVAMLGNRSTWHRALIDPHGHRRLMQRITVAGEELGGVA